MNEKQRLGLAWTRLNCWEWDDYVGEKPEGFDELPSYRRICCEEDKTIPLTKDDIIRPIMKSIEDDLGDKYISWCWWKYNLKKSYIHWFLWWHFSKDRIRD